jgi:4-aminobutyrate aminotransferase-like enzyme
MTTPELTKLISRRSKSLGPTYKLTYSEPIHMVRASGVYMYDADGRDYLDVYNNVPVVGHCHPHVVDALERQARLINTNTRYATDLPVELAERLLATMPAEIGNVIFVCSGSEANELAIRVSRSVTGSTGIIVTDCAYHGNGVATSGVSPSARRLPLGPDVYSIPAPRNGDNPDDFAGRIRDCIARMKKDGVKPAALLVDMILSTDGVIVDPVGYMAKAADEIRKAGGLFIADEVQPGFGRTGNYWGFQYHGVIPDLVTMGKPMGNGHPVAAMAARPELLARFSQQVKYFNTFGGNTVSCAVASAVLDVIEKENLIQNAKETGAYIREGLKRIAAKHAVIHSVRGVGLFTGVEIGPDARFDLDAKQATDRLANSLKQNGVLVGITGPNWEVLKVRPPLPFTKKNADTLFEKLELVLA